MHAVSEWETSYTKFYGLKNFTNNLQKAETFIAPKHKLYHNICISSMPKECTL